MPISVHLFPTARKCGVDHQACDSFACDSFACDNTSDGYEPP